MYLRYFVLVSLFATGFSTIQYDTIQISFLKKKRTKELKRDIDLDWKNLIFAFVLSSETFVIGLRKRQASRMTSNFSCKSNVKYQFMTLTLE